MKATEKLLAAGTYLAGSPARLGRLPPERFEGLATAVVLLSAGWGLAQVGIWEVSHRVFWVWLGHLNWIAQSGLAAGATVLAAYRRAAWALAETIVGPRRLWQAVAVAAMAAGAWSLYNALGWSAMDWPMRLPAAVEWLWPPAPYRVLLLAPVWGAWGMIVPGRFRRPDGRTDEPTRRFVGGIGPAAVVVYLALPLAGSLVYLNHLYPWHFVPPMAALGAAIGGGALVVRLRGRLDRGALLATNLLTQAAFVGGFDLVMGW